MEMIELMRNYEEFKEKEGISDDISERDEKYLFMISATYKVDGEFRLMLQALFEILCLMTKYDRSHNELYGLVGEAIKFYINETDLDTSKF